MNMLLACLCGLLMLSAQAWTCAAGEPEFVRKADVLSFQVSIPVSFDGDGDDAALTRNPPWAEMPVLVLAARDLSEKERERLRQAQVAAVLQKGLYSKGELMEEVCRAVQHGLGGGRKGGQA